MSNDSSSRTEEKYELALKEIEQYFEHEPERGREAGNRFELLAALSKEYKDLYC